MARYAMRLVGLLTAIAITMGALTVPSQAAAPPPAATSSVSVSTSVALARRMDFDWGWYKVTVWYSKYETQRIVATNGACSVVVGKAPGWVAKVLSGACGLIAVWAGYALARGRCVGVKVSYFMALPYGWVTREC